MRIPVGGGSNSVLARSLVFAATETDGSVTQNLIDSVLQLVFRIILSVLFCGNPVARMTKLVCTNVDQYLDRYPRT